MFGEPRYAAGFSHFDYVNPDAPKGGQLRFSFTGTFDSLNPLAPIGLAAFGVRQFVVESLMTRALDEPFTLYGLLAERVVVAADRRSIIFYIHPKAAFADGSAVRVDDVIFSANTLRTQGRPNHRFYYRSISAIKKIGTRGVQFIFTPEANAEMPLIIALMPIISKKHFTAHPFGESRTQLPVGSGPYVVERVEWGKRVVYRRNKNYWAAEANLAVQRGRHNFDRLSIDYWRDDNSRFQAFKTGALDFFEETSSTRWAESYNFTAIKKGEVQKKLFSLKIPAPMWAIALNTRRSLFADKLTRQALALTFDGAWINKNLFFNLWQRNYSFWARSPLASQKCCSPPLSGRQRKRKALALFQQAGWHIKNNRLSKKNKSFVFTIVVKSRLNERIALVWQRQLKQFGIRAEVRFIDDSQFERRKQTYDYDVIFAHWYLSLSPGNEQHYYWSSEAAATPGSRNYAGIRARAIDQQIKRLNAARSQNELTRAVKKLDALLLSGNYVIPLFFAPQQWVALRQSIGVPRNENFYGYQIDTWWRQSLP